MRYNAILPRIRWHDGREGCYASIRSVSGYCSKERRETVYIGVVGPVRTGKSTFIKRLMETMVIPAIENAHIRARAQDDLPAKRFRKNGHDNETGVCSR